MKKKNSKDLLIKLMKFSITLFILYFLVEIVGMKLYLVIVIFVVLTITYLLLMANKIASKAFENRFQRLKECEKCKAIIPKEADVCSNCGANLTIMIKNVMD